MIAPEELIVDLFAGGGGASQGIFQALGRHPNIAVNHDEDAVAVHTRNHAETDHRCESVWTVKPEVVCAGRPVGLLWASPDCRHFSRAAGGQPKWGKVRSLPGVVLTWAKRVRPRVILVENVREMLGWGPLLDDGTPCPDRIGRSFNQWIGRLRGLGYKVQWRELCAADYGAPTIRSRLFVQARMDGEPITWPTPTHARTPSLFASRPWLTAADCIDWSRPCPSIFTRSRPLQEATLRRIAHGINKFILVPDPFIVRDNGAFLAPITHRGESRGSAISAPVPTVTCAHRGEHALISATLAQRNEQSAMAPHIGALYGTSIGHAPDAPLGTVTAGGNHHALVAAFLAQHNGGAVGRDAREPVATITTSATQTQAVTAHLSDTDRAGAERVGAFLIHYFSSGKQGQDLRHPLGTVTTHDRYALVTVAGVRLPIVDIGMRMLQPDELARAQGFPADYDLTDGGRLTKTKTVHLIGNSVCPPIAEAVVRSAFGQQQAWRDAA